MKKLIFLLAVLFLHAAVIAQTSSTTFTYTGTLNLPGGVPARSGTVYINGEPAVNVDTQGRFAINLCHGLRNVDVFAESGPYATRIPYQTVVNPNVINITLEPVPTLRLTFEDCDSHFLQGVVVEWTGDDGRQRRDTSNQYGSVYFVNPQDDFEVLARARCSDKQLRMSKEEGSKTDIICDEQGRIEPEAIKRYVRFFEFAFDSLNFDIGNDGSIYATTFFTSSNDRNFKRLYEKIGCGNLNDAPFFAEIARQINESIESDYVRLESSRCPSRADLAIFNKLMSLQINSTVLSLIGSGFSTPR